MIMIVGLARRRARRGAMEHMHGDNGTYTWGDGQHDRDQGQHCLGGIPLLTIHLIVGDGVKNRGQRWWAGL